MAKRKEETPAPGSPAWMATFSDLMNLLLCFFILLFASSTIDAEKLEQISASFAKDNIFQAGSTAIGEGHMMSSGVKQLSVLDNYVSSMGRNQNGSSANLSNNDDENLVEADSTTASELHDDTVSQTTTQQDTSSPQATQQNSNTTTEQLSAQSADDLKKQVEETGYQQSAMMNEEIEKMLKNSQISSQVSLSYNAQFIELSLNGGVLFESGKAELTSDAKKLVSKVGDILVKYRKRTIEIEGHTDNVPIASNEFKNNQFLSAARAISVYEYLLENKNLIPENMKHSGYGDAKPKASNDTAKGRAKNRRVEIKIYNKISSESN